MRKDAEMKKNSKPIAIFPMRGQPPNIGHILTIVKIYDDYDEIILHILGNPFPYYNEEEFIIPPKEVVSIFKKMFKYMPKIKVILGKQPLRDRTSFDDLPHFDIIVTGNKSFIKTVKGKKPVRFVPRSKIHGFDISGTMLRKVMRDKT